MSDVQAQADASELRERTRRHHPAQAAASLATTWTAVVLVAALTVAAVAAGFGALYRDFWGPEAFVQRYLELLDDGRGTDALNMPGVPLARADLERAGLPANASDALLRGAALGSITDVRTSAATGENGIVTVTATYLADGQQGQTAFEVEPTGWEGLTPSWRFARSPLTVIDVTVRGSMRFEVNGFEIDKRQVSPAGTEADPLDSIPMLVFAPGLYTVSVDTAAAVADGAKVLTDAPLSYAPVEVQATATGDFVDVVQQKVEEFLLDCAEQPVLQPTGCPFGIEIPERVEEPPVWSIAEQPDVEVVPDGAHWAIPPTDAKAHIELDVRSIADGTIYHLSEDIPFVLDGTIEILADGTADIRVGSPTVE